MHVFTFRPLEKKPTMWKMWTQTFKLITWYKKTQFKLLIITTIFPVYGTCFADMFVNVELLSLDGYFQFQGYLGD